MVVEDVDIESLVAPRSARAENMEPGEYEAYVKTLTENRQSILDIEPG